MDMRSWKKVLLQWVNECGFMERNYFNIEQTDIDVFYRNFCSKHPKTANLKYPRLSDFLKEFYPQCECHMDDENCISSADYIYIYSMLLHFCCVRHPETVFHEICQRLAEHAQQCIASFFKELIDKESPNKETLRHAIAHVVSSNLTPPRMNESFANQQSVSGISVGIGSTSAGNSSGSLPSPTFLRCDSPLKTPKRCAGPQRISPTTPKTSMLEERTRELNNLKAQLETERYEKGLLEVQIKQNEDKILKLNQDHKKLVQQIQDLKNDILFTTSEGNSSTKRDSEDQIRKRILKEMAQKESELSKLTDVVRTLHEEKSLVLEKLRYADKQIVICMTRIKDLDYKVDELTDDIEKKNDTIKYLTTAKLELEQFINEIRGSSKNPSTDLNTSMDCFDSSFVRNIGNTNTSSNVGSPENLGASVVDVQLREKEHENSKLKEELELVKDEHKKLAKSLHDIAEKQAKEFDIVIEQNVSDANQSEHNESSQENPLEQLNLFSNCMEKISRYHQTEKQKVKDLEEESRQLEEFNKALNQKINELTEEIAHLRESQSTGAKLNAELLHSKSELQSQLDSYLLEMERQHVQKQDLFVKLQRSTKEKEELANCMANLRTDLELLQASNRELLKGNHDVKERNQDMQLQLERLQKSSSDKISDLDLQIKALTEKLSKQAEEIAEYITAEQSIKLGNEKLLIQNEELKRKSREADDHLTDITKELSAKQGEINKLAGEIADLTQKNATLEAKIDAVLNEHKQEKISHENDHVKYEQDIHNLQQKIKTMEQEYQEEKIQTQADHGRQIKTFEDKISMLQKVIDETSNLILIKSKENQEFQHILYDAVVPKVNNLLQLLQGPELNEDWAENMRVLEKFVVDLHKENNQATSELKSLQIQQQEYSSNMEMLSKDLAEKNDILSQHEEELQQLQELRQQCLEYEGQIEKLKERQLQFVEKVKVDVTKKEQEFSDRMQQASKEYEASLERIRIELKHEKEHYNNKERELLLVCSEHNDVKKQLNTKEQEIEKLSSEISLLKQQNSKMKLLESRVAEYSGENEKLQKEIESFKQEVNQNARRLLEADTALNELMVIARDQDTNKEQMLKMKKVLEEKEQELLLQTTAREELQQKVQQQEEHICNLSEEVKSLEEDKESLMHDIQDYVEQIQRIQEEKSILLNSLEKSADQLKLSIVEKERQSDSLKQKYFDAKEQLDALTMQNTKLQGDLVEREAELRLAQEDQEQEREESQEIIKKLKQQLSESSEQMETFDTALLEIAAIMENNFNLTRELQNEEEIKNIFNFQEEQEENGRKLNHIRKNLNLLLHFDSQLQLHLKELTMSVEEKNKSAECCQKTISDLQHKLKHQDTELAELREQVENEEVIVEKRVAQEIRRLEDDLQNLENINERLTNGNFDMQMAMGNLEQDLKTAKSKLDKLEEEKLALKEEVCTKTTLLEKQKQEEKKIQQTLKEKSQQYDKLTEKCKLLEAQQKEKTTKLQSVEKDLQTFKEKAAKQQEKITQQQHQIQSLQNEQKKLHESIKQLQASNDTLESEVALKNKELLCCKNKIAELLQSLQNNEQQLELTSKKLDESEAVKLNSEAKCERMFSESQQLLRDIEFLKAQQQCSGDESIRFTKEIESLKQDKHHLREEIRDTKSDLQRANDNVTQLIQQISSIRLEKEAVIEENSLLKKQLEETGKHHTSSETKLKSIVEKSQEFERKLLTADNELKSVKACLEKSELNNERLTNDNKKLRDTQETSTKRIEKLALKLGDSQARSTKLERDNEKLAKTLEANATTVEALQKEKDVLQNEAKSLKERVSRAERSHEQLVAKVHNLELMNSQLQESKQKLEASEIDAKSKFIKLEKLRDVQEEKIRKLSNSLHNAEHNNVKLNLEIGALNSQVQEAKSLNAQEQLQDLRHKIQTIQEERLRYEELTGELQQALDAIKEEKSSLSDQLSKVSLNLQISKEKCSELSSEMEQMRADLLILREEKSQIELHHKTSTERLKNLEMENDTLLRDRECSVASLETRISTLEEKLAEKSKEVNDLQHEIHSLQESSQSHSAMIMQHQTSSNNQTEELDSLRAKLSVANETLAKEQEIVTQLKLDNHILHTKYQESKQRVLDAAKISEERIKENRLELEGKLEKMKNKMKTLYTEEITKMKTKQEREMAVLKSETEVIKAQNTKYEEHVRKLSNQIVRLNDNILECQKENALLSTKLKHLMEPQDTEKFKRPNSIHVSTISSSTGPVVAPNIGTNLAMEDEEGEVFNTTYLTDMKAGRMTDFMSREVCAEELKYRNSLLPPHLKSSYAAQFDHDCPEDELKDGPHSMDDSMSALLSTTAGGTRKKCTGVTHYKRPGPPTPSKNGRLSFGGGSGEPMREILKDSFESNPAVSSSKTPARFTFFASRFSMGNVKDEKPHDKRETHANMQNLPKDCFLGQHKTALKKPAIAPNRRLLSGVVCTSTPRKSKDHFDQRRLIQQLLTSSPSPSPLAIEHTSIKTEKKISPPDVSIIETPVTALPSFYDLTKAPARKQTTAKRLEAIAVGLKNKRRNSSIYGRRLSRRMEEICTPTSGETTSSAAAFSNTPKDKRGGALRRQTLNSATTTTSGCTGNQNEYAKQQRRIRKKMQRYEDTVRPRPSLHMRGTMFVKYRNPHKGNQRDLNKHKSRKQRNDHFNRGRNIKSPKGHNEDSTEEEEEEDEETIIRNLTYDIKNNNFAPTYNRNDKLLGQTVVLTKRTSSQNVTKQKEENFTFSPELLESQNNSDEQEWDLFDDNFYEDEIYDTEEYDEEEYQTDDKNKDIKTTRDDHNYDYDIKYKIPIKTETAHEEEDKDDRICKEELVTSFELEEFDRLISKKASNTEFNAENYYSHGSSEEFEKLLLETESSAPFHIKHIQYEQSQLNTSHLETFVSTPELQTEHDVTTAAPHPSPGSPASGHLSRTIYGGTVIYNRRLPNINTTYVRKSSIYIKNKHNSINDSNDVVLITNQTITLVDLARMFRQMDSSARVIVSFAVLASVTTLLGLFVSFCSKR